MKLKSSCCEKYRRKAKACRRCPALAALGQKKRKRKLKRLRRGLERVA